MSPIEIQPFVISMIDEQKWQRLAEMQEQHLAMSMPRNTIRMRFMRASGNALIAIGHRLQQSAGLPIANDLEQACA